MDFQGFVGPSYTARLLQTNAERCSNLYPERLESVNAKPSFILRRTPGIVTKLETFNGRVLGQFQQDGRSFAVDNGVGATSGRLYETTTGIGVALGNVTTNGQPVSFDTNGAANGAGGHQLVVCSAGHGYVYDLLTGVFAEITVAGFPTGSALAMLYFDGMFLVLTQNFIGQSTLEDGTAWSAAARGSRSIASDLNVNFINNYPQHTLWIFGSVHTEVWYDNGGTTFSFGPIPGVFLNIGLAAKDTLKRFNGSLAWLGQDEHGNRIVYASGGYSAVRISTTAIEYDLATFADVSDFVGFVYQEEGHEFYVLTSILNKRTWVYDAKEQLWHTRMYLNPTNGIEEQIRAWTHVVAPNGDHWVTDWDKGILYRQSLTLYDDNGSPQQWLRQMPHLLQQNRRIFYPGLELQLTQGQGLPAGLGSDPKATLQWSDDGGETWGNQYIRSIGVRGAYANRTLWQNLGAGRNRVFKVFGNDPTPLALTACYLQPDPVVGSN